MTHFSLFRDIAYGGYDSDDMRELLEVLKELNPSLNDLDFDADNEMDLIDVMQDIASGGVIDVESDVYDVF